MLRGTSLAYIVRLAPCFQFGPRNWGTFSLRIQLPRLKPESEEFLHLDVLRIVASLGIVAFHWRLWLHLDPGLAALVRGMDGWSCFVDLFFLISGFIICHVYATRMNTIAEFGSFLRKRLARLGPLHWATLAFFAAAAYAAHVANYTLQNPENYDFHCLAPNAALLHSFGFCNTESFNAPSWSISAEMGCYVLFPLILALYRINVWLPAVAGLAMIAVLSWIGPIGPENEPWYNLTYYWSVLRALPEFAFGVTLYGIRDRLRIPLAGVAMYLALALLALLGQFAVSEFWMLLCVYLIVVLGIAADQAGKHGAITRWLAPLGALTYSVYMLHMPLGSVILSDAAIRMLGLPPEAMNFAILAAVPLLFVISYLSLVMFEKPARRWLSGSSKKPRPAVSVPAE